MSEEIKKYDYRNNLIYLKSPDGYELWEKYDENNNLIHHKRFDEYGFFYEFWCEYDENNLMYYKNSNNYEKWYKYDNSGKRIETTEKEYKEIEFRKKEKEYNSRTKCSRFELMDI